MGAAGCDAAGKLKTAAEDLMSLYKGMCMQVQESADRHYCRKKRRKASSDEDCSEPGDEDVQQGATASYSLRPPKKVEAADIALESDIAQLQVR